MSTVEQVAIVGLAGRFPMAHTIGELWNNIKGGVEAINTLDEEALIASGVSSSELNQPHYIPRKGVLEDADCFDAAFFGYTPYDTKWMDPQQRVFLECCYHALEDAGYHAASYKGDIGVFAASSYNTYLFYHLKQYPHLFEDINFHQMVINNSSDFLATRVAYKLDLRGPAQGIQTACSSSLVAIHQACQTLLDYQCDMAIAGGVSITTPLKEGYIYKRESIASADGSCRPFDADASGTVPGNGAGVVALKRLSDAVAGGDHIYAVVKGSAINNDGNDKVGFTAPSVRAQADVVQAAHVMAAIEPESIGLVETHGTGTLLGDPVEIKGLQQAFGDIGRRQYCALTSVKANIGHLDAAAGVVGFLRAVLSLHHKTLPPSINVTNPSPNIAWEDSPFYVNTALQDWDAPHDYPRRAGVSSFGMGGTNAHAILEEWYDDRPHNSVSENTLYPLPLSAKTGVALDSMAHNLKEYLHDVPHSKMEDVVFTLDKGRAVFDQRACLFFDQGQKAIVTLDACNQSLPASLKHMAEQWIEKGVADWSAYYDKTHARRISLPLYPFERTRFWLSDAVSSCNKEATTPVAVHSYPQKNLGNIVLEAIKHILYDLTELESMESFRKQARISDFIDSLAIIDLMCKVEKQFGYPLSVEEIEQHSTIGELAEYIERRCLEGAQKQAADKNTENVVPLYTHQQTATLHHKWSKDACVKQPLAVLLKHGDASVPPLFCIHPAGGSVMVFHDLCHHMTSDRAIIAIQSRGWQEDEIIDDNIDIMASIYASIILDIQPHGPYFFCGSSMGGSIAYALAQHFGSENIGVLAMFDTPSPTYSSIIPEKDEGVLAGLKEFSPQIYQKLLNIEKTKPGSLEKFIALWRAHHHAAVAFDPKPYGGEILFFRAKERDQFTSNNLEKGWYGLAQGGIRIHEVPGNHISMHLSPHVKNISMLLENAIVRYEKLRPSSIQQIA